LRRCLIEQADIERRRNGGGEFQRRAMRRAIDDLGVVGGVVAPIVAFGRLNDRV